MLLGELIKEFRLKNGITMQEFADRTGLSKGYISMIERNRHPKTGLPISPSMSNVQKMASVMNLGLDDLMSLLDDSQGITINETSSTIKPSVLGERVKERREELGLTQENLAHMVGYGSRSTIAKIEVGTNDIPQSKVSAFATALETTPSYLLGLDNSAEPTLTQDDFPVLVVSGEDMSLHRLGDTIIVQNSTTSQSVATINASDVDVRLYNWENLAEPTDQNQGEKIKRLLISISKDGITESD